MFTYSGGTPEDRADDGGEAELYQWLDARHGILVHEQQFRGCEADAVIFVTSIAVKVSINKIKVNCTEFVNANFIFLDTDTAAPAKLLIIDHFHQFNFSRCSYPHLQQRMRGDQAEDEGGGQQDQQPERCSALRRCPQPAALTVN